MKDMNSLDWITLVLVIVGALNWGLVGFFQWNLVSAIFGSIAWLERAIYALVGLSALWMIYKVAMHKK